MKYATRINSFLRTGATLPQALAAIGKMQGVDYVDLNYPEHFAEYAPAEIQTALRENGLRLNAINLRFRKEFLNGVFSNNDAAVCGAAVQLSIEAAEVCEQLAGRQIIIWLSYDGFDYSFQMDYAAKWKQLVASFREVCDATSLPVSIEYKPYEERVYAFLDSFGMTRLLLEAVGRENLGMTLDFCHMLMKHENPALAAQLLLEEGKLYTVHINDGAGRTDDGLMVGSVHPWQTLELFYYLKRYRYDGVIYFDTFPLREAAVEECRWNYQMCRRFEEIIDREGIETIEAMVRGGDATRMMELLYSSLGAIDEDAKK